MDELIEEYKARLIVAGVAFGMLRDAFEGITLDADIVEQRATLLMCAALGGV